MAIHEERPDNIPRQLTVVARAWKEVCHGELAEVGQHVSEGAAAAVGRVPGVVQRHLLHVH